MHDTQRNVHLDVMEPVGHDALEQFVCGRVRGRADEDARLWRHIWQTATSRDTMLGVPMCQAADTEVIYQLSSRLTDMTAPSPVQAAVLCIVQLTTC